MVRCLTIFAIATIFSGCGHCPTPLLFNPPPRPVLVNYTQSQWDALPADIKKNINADDLAIKEYILKVESRAKIHNEAVTP